MKTINLFIIKIILLLAPLFCIISSSQAQHQQRFHTHGAEFGELYLNLGWYRTLLYPGLPIYDTIKPRIVGGKSTQNDNFHSLL